MGRTATGLLVFLALGLVACSTDRPRPVPASLKTGYVPETRSLTGTLVVRDRRALPPGALVTLRLTGIVAGSPSVLAERLIPVAGSPVMAFQIDLPAPVLQTARDRVLAAVLSTAGGDRLLTAELALPRSYDGGPLEDLLLAPPAPEDGAIDPAPAAEVAGNAAPWVGYLCDRSGHISVKLSGQQLALRMGDVRYGLVQVPSASGVKFDGDAVTFWEKGGTALFQRDDYPAEDCMLARRAPAAEAMAVPAEPEDPIEPVVDVWAKAAARGDVFRAVGSEPGWHVVFTGDGMLDLTWAYGEQRTTVPLPAPVRRDGVLVYEVDPETADLTVMIRKADCADPMSGEASPNRVAVVVGSSILQGCGRWLSQQR